MAWLNTAPDNNSIKGERQTRLQAMSVPPPFPPNPARYLTDWLFDIGPTVPAGMGEGAIGYTDLAAWQALSGVELLPWEASTLRRLSLDFVIMRQEAKKPGCPQPWEESEADIQDRVTSQFAAMMQALKAKGMAKAG